LPNQRWQIALAEPKRAARLAEVTGLDPALAQVLINREMGTPERARVFLDPELQVLPSPLEEFPDLAIAVELLGTAIAKQQRIAICGDYDADGMTSTALLWRSLRYLGGRVEYAIPSRMQEGYGINHRIVEEFHQRGVRLILTVDNGIAAYGPIDFARGLGMTVIVTDHHDIPPKLPPAHAILNPKLIDEASPYRGVAGVGVAYILAVCLAQAMNQMQELTGSLLELFTLGTIADLAPLTGVNRRWVRRGLKLLPQSQLAGVQALIQVAGLNNGQEALKPEAIGFRLGPRINAVGRIADPQIVIELLTTDDPGRALELAEKCEEVNQLRQRLCELIEQEAIAWVEQSSFDVLNDRVLLVVHPDWHHGVIGIVASRLVERYGVPVFIATYEDETRQQVRGSARGIPEFNVFEALQCCNDLMEKFGGHRAAGGFSLKAEHLDEMRSRLRIFANMHLQPQYLKPLVSIDAQANFSQINLELFKQIDQLHPCGIENADPVFWTPNVRIVEQRTIGRDQSHLKLTLADDGYPGTIKAIAWRWGEYHPLPSRVDIAYRLRLNEWNGERNVELELVGVRSPESPSDPSKSAEAANSLPLIEQDAGQQLQLGEALELPTLEQPEGDRSPESLTVDPDGLLSGLRTSPAIEGRSVESDLEDDADLSDSPPGVEFYFNKRKYLCRITMVQDERELHIHNPEGHLLAVQPQQAWGWLGQSREDAQRVDVSQPYYFNLIRAALNALEIAEKSDLLKKKDRLIVEKDQQIDTLTQQLELLDQQLSQLSAEQQQQFQALQASLQQREVAIQQQETHIGALQTQLSQNAPPIDPESLKQSLKGYLGDPVWFRLNPRSQTDLCSADQTYYQIRSETYTAEITDYSAAGLRLGAVVAREVSQPFFRALYDFWLSNGDSLEVGSVVLKSKKKYALSLLPPLLAPQWTTFRAEALRLDRIPSDEELYSNSSSIPAGISSATSAGAQSVNQSDRDRVTQFLQAWEHPLATWLSQSDTAAATIDQIHQLYVLATEANTLLYEWQFGLMRSLILGEDVRPGLLQEVYGRRSYR